MTQHMCGIVDIPYVACIDKVVAGPVTVPTVLTVSTHFVDVFAINLVGNMFDTPDTNWRQVPMIQPVARQVEVIGFECCRHA